MGTLLELMAAQRRDYMELVRTQCHELALAQAAQRRRDVDDTAASSPGPDRVGAAGQATGNVHNGKAEIQDTEVIPAIEAKMADPARASTGQAAQWLLRALATEAVEDTKASRTSYGRGTARDTIDNVKTSISAAAVGSGVVEASMCSDGAHASGASFADEGSSNSMGTIDSVKATINSQGVEIASDPIEHVKDLSSDGADDGAQASDGEALGV